MRQRTVDAVVRFIEGIIAFLDNILYVVVDQRVIISFLAVIAVLFGVPKIAEDSELLSNQIADLIMLVGQFLTVIVAVIKVIDSWDVREPQGIHYGTKRIERLAAQMVVDALRSEKSGE